MYYSGRDGTTSISESGREQNTIRVLSAVSGDGLTFTKEEGIRIDSTVVENRYLKWRLKPHPDILNIYWGNLNIFLTGSTEGLLKSRIYL